MPIAIITGSGGLVGSESVSHFVREGYDVVGLDNDMRAEFFGPTASTQTFTDALNERHDAFDPLALDIRDADGIDGVFARHARDLAIIVHTAAQPSHDWAATDPVTDFTVNANGNLNPLQAARRHAPDATFVNMSTNKIYGDTPNALPLVELERSNLPRTTVGTSASTPRCRSTDPPTRCSGSPRRPATCWCRSPVVTFRCRRSASAGAASPVPIAPAPSCTASSPT
jgi:nucleoside-diphosphate-sugar epimerase